MRPNFVGGLETKTTLLSSLLTAGYLVNAITAAIHLPIAKDRNVEAAQLQAARLRRRGTVVAALGNVQQLGLYYANITVGTPAQAVALQIDTGSSDVWLPSASAALCSVGQECVAGAFDANASSTFKIVGQDEFNISYVDRTGATGSYFVDSFGIDGNTLQEFEMGLAEDTSISIGIMGIGYANSVANVFTGNGSSYENLPLALVSAGLITSPAYSLWLDDISSSTGSILFGGIDTSKYVGQLRSITVYPSARRGIVDSFTVAFTSLHATSSSGSDQLTPNGYAQPVILDSGTTLTLLPDEITAVLFQELGAIDDEALQAVVVPCSLADNSGTIDFGFDGPNGPVIKVPVSEIVLPLILTTGATPRYENGDEACQLGIQAAGDLPILFGDTFLRSAYVVYDLANNEIALAQANFDPEERSSNVIEFASMGARIPEALPTATMQNGVSQTETGIPRDGHPIVTGDGVVTWDGAPTSTDGLEAARGFRQNNAAVSRPGPLGWESFAALGLWVGIMVFGGGMLTFLE